MTWRSLPGSASSDVSFQCRRGRISVASGNALMKWRSLQESGSYRDMRPLREIFAERKDAIAQYVPADVQAVHARSIAELKAQGVAAQAVSLFKAGAPSPSFELPDRKSTRLNS